MAREEGSGEEEAGEPGDDDGDGNEEGGAEEEDAEEITGEGEGRRVWETDFGSICGVSPSRAWKVVDIAHGDDPWG